MQAETNKEQLNFQAEAKQLLRLMIHSLYSNKEIFLRELISNASDAADKLRFEGLTDAALYESDTDLKIRVSYDADERTVTISDNGIGMSRQEVIDHIGTIAKSGTREFFNSLTGDQVKDAHLIGQFGVGFYSAFIVANKVTLITRRAGLTAEHGVRWESSGEGDYTLETVEKVARGTDIILHLRADEDEFLNGIRIRNIIRKYSDHITLPIVMKKEEWSQDESCRSWVASQINSKEGLISICTSLENRHYDQSGLTYSIRLDLLEKIADLGQIVHNLKALNYDALTNKEKQGVDRFHLAMQQRLQNEHTP